MVLEQVVLMRRSFIPSRFCGVDEHMNSVEYNLWSWNMLYVEEVSSFVGSVECTASI